MCAKIKNAHQGDKTIGEHFIVRAHGAIGLRLYCTITRQDRQRALVGDGGYMFTQEMFVGTIKELRDELKFSNVPHRVEKRNDVSMVIRLDGILGVDFNIQIPSFRTPSKWRPGEPFIPDEPQAPSALSAPRALGVINAITQGDRVRMEVNLDNDSTKRLYADIRERWDKLRDYLESIGRLERKPGAGTTKPEPQPSIPPMTDMQTAQPTKRGPRHFDSDTKRQIVEEYLKVKDKIKQEDFCVQRHISDRQLRRWIVQYKKDKL